MGMTVTQIDEWKERRLKEGGAWISSEDFLLCLFYAMEGTGPCHGNWDHQPTVKWSYVRLVEIGCEYLRETKDMKALEEFLTRVFGYGISYLTESQKKRFAEQTSWMLNLPLFREILALHLALVGARVPDSDILAMNWSEAREQYKHRI